MWSRFLANNDLYEFDTIIKSLQSLKKSGIFTENNCSMVTTYANSSDLAEVLAYLQEAKILNQDNFSLVAAHANSSDLAKVLSCLREASILNQDNFSLVAAHANLIRLFDGLFYLQLSNFLNQDNFYLIAAHPNPSDLAKALSSLQEAQILNQGNFSLVATHANLNDLTDGISYLQLAQILNQDNFSLVASHANPMQLADGFFYLNRMGILNQEIRGLVAAHADPSFLVRTLSYLQEARILNQDNFAALISPNHAILISSQARQLVWSRIPNDFLTQDIFQRLLIAAEHANPMAELQRVRDQVIGVAGARHAAAFNPGQSTHTASVHQSVSASAAKLMQNYGPDLNLEIKIREIKAYVNGLDDSPKHQAAKRCIERITRMDYTFTDSSGVSIRQLLALAYTAIHDKTKCLAELEDAKALFVEGLYEIQRGYNFNDVGQDQGGNDRPICTGGSFNKLIEKLNGIHQEVEVYFITHQGALNKLPILAAEYAKAYLQAQVSSVTAEDYRRVKGLFESLKKDDSLEPIWNEIKEEVIAKLWDEFKEVYNNKENARFKDLINSVQYLPLPDLSDIEKTLSGFQAYLDEEAHRNEQMLLSLERNSLWANLQESPKEQDGFDNTNNRAYITKKLN